MVFVLGCYLCVRILSLLILETSFHMYEQLSAEFPFCWNMNLCSHPQFLHHPSVHRVPDLVGGSTELLELKQKPYDPIESEVY